MPKNPLASMPSFGRFEMSREEFEDAVDEALELIPSEVAEAITNVAVVVQERSVLEPVENPGGELLGLYEGTPLTERGSWWDAGSLPDRILIFRQPILDRCLSREEVVAEVVTTVLHEVGHYFGISDDRLDELGWG
jgi:predicted Zn-dependent protease with MMP-like domain